MSVLIGNRTIEIFPPTEMGPVTFERMSGGEALGSPFEFDVDVLSATGDIPVAKVLGKPFSVALEQPPPPLLRHVGSSNMTAPSRPALRSAASATANGAGSSPPSYSPGFRSGRSRQPRNNSTPSAPSG